MDKIKKILNRETVLYIIFGVATTVVNYVVFYLLYNVLWNQSHSLAANAAAFVAAVIFAFVVNKLFVFESKSWSADTLKREIPSFLAARILRHRGGRSVPLRKGPEAGRRHRHHPGRRGPGLDHRCEGGPGLRGRGPELCVL